MSTMRKRWGNKAHNERFREKEKEEKARMQERIKQLEDQVSDLQEIVKKCKCGANMGGAVSETGKKGGGLSNSFFLIMYSCAESGMRA